jgi:rhodanese-related sulfurtransferase
MPYSLPDVPEITVAEFVGAFAPRDVQLLDVREMDEWRAGHIADSFHIPLAEVAMRTADLDPGKPVIAVCHSGVRSLYAADILRKAGFRDARSLVGGIVAWVEAGQTITFE